MTRTAKAQDQRNWARSVTTSAAYQRNRSPWTSPTSETPPSLSMNIMPSNVRKRSRFENGDQFQPDDDSTHGHSSCLDTGSREGTKLATLIGTVATVRPFYYSLSASFPQKTLTAPASSPERASPLRGDEGLEGKRTGQSSLRISTTQCSSLLRGRRPQARHPAGEWIAPPRITVRPRPRGVLGPPGSASVAGGLRHRTRQGFPDRYWPPRSSFHSAWAQRGGETLRCSSRPRP
jgi:hypothetical protein